MRALGTIAMLLTGCSGMKGDPFDPDAEAQLPRWIEQELDGQEAACSSSPYWNDGVVMVATTFFAGDYAWSGDSLVGNEFWVMFPDNDLAATGFVDCVVVWDVIGTRGDPVRAGNYSVTVNALIDEDQTDCNVSIDGDPVYVGEENFTATYDVLEVSGGVQVFFAGSGERLGRGEANGQGFSWLSDKNCMAF